MSYEEEYEKTEHPGYYTYHTPPKAKKKNTGLLVALAVLALVTGVVSWAVNFMDLTVDFGKNNMTVSLGEQQEENGLPPAERTREPKPAAKGEDGLMISETPYSAENYPSSAEQALSLQQIYEKVSPSVASISCISETGAGTGTGIVMSQDGYVITNYHVIEHARQVFVQLPEGEPYEAELIGGDEITDLAVLKIEAQNLQAAEFGDSDKLRVGDCVVAIGDPLGAQLRGTMTDGIVSAINRDLNLSGRQMTLIQTNAALNSGNSGGPLINCYGQVVGINTMKLSSHYGNTSLEGLGFAIPMVQAKPIIDELIGQGYVSGRPAIGIEGQSVDLGMQVFYHLPPGVIITQIVEDSHAFEAGLQVNDLIVEFEGSAITSLEDLVAAKENCMAGDEIRLTIFRGGQYYYADLELMDQIKPDIY